MRCNQYGDSLYSFKYDSCLSGSIVLLNDSEAVTPGLYSYLYATHITKFNFINGDTMLVKSYPLNFATGYMHRCPDGGYIMLNYNAGNYTYIKVDGNCNMEWHQDPNMAVGAMQIKPDPLGGFVAFGNHGYTSNPYGVQRLDSAGLIVWNFGYGDVPFVDWDYNYDATDVVITDDSNYIVTCYDFYETFMKINRVTGDTIWTKSGESAYVINNGGNDTYLTVTSNNVGLWSFGLINGNGDFIWQTPVVPTNFFPSYCSKTLDGGFAFCGQTSNYQTMVFVKLDSTGNVTNASMYDIEKHKQIYFYPNPVRDVLNFSAKQTTGNFTFCVYNFSGNKVVEVKNKSSVDVSALPAGFYVAEVREGEKVVREKFVKE